MPPTVYWIKFSNSNTPEKWHRDSFIQFWEDLKTFMIRNNTGYIEWIIRD